MKPFQRHTFILALVLILCTLGLALVINRQHVERIAVLRVTQTEIIAELRLLRAASLTPVQMREAVMHGSVDAEDERQRRRWKKEDELAKFRAQPAPPPASVDDAVQRALRMAAGQAP